MRKVVFNIFDRQRENPSVFFNLGISEGVSSPPALAPHGREPGSSYTGFAPERFHFFSRNHKNHGGSVSHKNAFPSKGG